MINHYRCFRCYATLKDIQIRLKAIKNIGKITKSMKMISSTKLNKAQRVLDSARVFKSGIKIQF